MIEISFSVMRNTPETEPVLRRVLDNFERAHGIRVQLQVLAWETARQETKEFAIRQHGPDVSTMATTWVADLIAMNALAPLTPQGVTALSRDGDFIDAAWATTRGQQNEQPYAAPWLVDTYIVHYRRDLLENAGVDARTAFASLAGLDDAVYRLSKAGVPVPIQLPYHYDRFCTMHTLAAWVWAQGGEFCTPDGKRVTFDQPGALAGIRQYFNIARHLSPGARQRLSAIDSLNLFRQGEAALAFGTRSFQYSPETIAAHVLENWAAASLPAPHFVGGVNLVTWKYSRREQAALELIRYLNRPDVVLECSQAMLTSPARLAALNGPEYAQDPILSVVSESARGGRCYPSVPLWGLVEDRFTEALAAIGASVLAPGSSDPLAAIPQIIQGAARRLNLTLESH